VADTFSLEAWIRPTVTSGGIASLGTGGGALRMASGQLSAGCTGVAVTVTSGSVTMAAGSVNHCVYTKAGAAQHLYLNGVDVTTVVASATAAAATLIYVGNNPGDPLFTGTIDEVAVYDYPLTAAQVAANYNNGIAAPPASGATPVRQIGLRGSALGAPYVQPQISAFTVSWVADDPAAYAYAGKTLTISPAQIAAGRQYNLTYPRAYVQSAPGGYGTAQNGGSYQTWPRFKIYGPCTNPAIYYQAPATGQIVTVGMTVNAGDYVLIDTRAATVLYNGQAGASRYSEVDFTQTTWAPFPPGSTGIRFVTQTQSAPCALEVDWSDAFLQ
jgi:hypothetical protein